MVERIVSQEAYPDNCNRVRCSRSDCVCYNKVKQENALKKPIPGCGRASVSLHIAPKIQSILDIDVKDRLQKVLLTALAKLRTYNHDHQFIQQLFQSQIVSNPEFKDYEHLRFRTAKIENDTIKITFGRVFPWEEKETINNQTELAS